MPSICVKCTLSGGSQQLAPYQPTRSKLLVKPRRSCRRRRRRRRTPSHSSLSLCLSNSSMACLLSLRSAVTATSRSPLYRSTKMRMSCKVLEPRPRLSPQQRHKQYDVFINHRGVDTKQTVAGLIHDRLVHLGLRTFLDSRSMEPGDRLYESINSAILGCKVGIAIFSPRYCESLACLQELATLVEAKKKLIPIFYDVRPSELRLPLRRCHNSQPVSEMLDRFSNALQEAKYTVGITFDSHNGNWAELLSRTADVVVKSMKEEGRELCSIELDNDSSPAD